MIKWTSNRAEKKKERKPTVIYKEGNGSWKWKKERNFLPDRTIKNEVASMFLKSNLLIE